MSSNILNSQMFWGRIFAAERQILKKFPVDSLLAGAQSFALRSRSALAMTLTDESAIAAAAITGDSVRPKTG
jgi:hypothetical protein